MKVRVAWKNGAVTLGEVVSSRLLRNGKTEYRVKMFTPKVLPDA